MKKEVPFFLIRRKHVIGRVRTNLVVKATELTAAYVSKGFITTAQAEAIIAETTPAEQEGRE